MVKVLSHRGVKTSAERQVFLKSDYAELKHDPFLMTDMNKAVKRLKSAFEQGEKVTIYGDYDIDGMTATVLLWDSFRKFGINVETYTPNRFSEGYGLNIDAVEKIASDGTKLIITVDNGTLSFAEIARANELGVDVIVTDHHSPHDELPDAVAVLNPKVAVARNPDAYDEKFVLKKSVRRKLYPFADLCGVGVAFKLVQAMQTELEGLPDGQEKWLLDLVALGTVCDVVGLVDENRANVKWGLEVMKKTRRPGLRALLAVAGVDQQSIDARTLGFVLGPRLNAAGRLETAEMALELLKTDDNMRALELAEKLEALNKERRKVQDEIFRSAVNQVDDDPVAIAVGDGWHEGVIGIVASKILEKFEKPTFVMARGAEFTKASGRSFGEFSMAAAIHHTDGIIEKGGGHAAAGGLTVRNENLEKWRTMIQEFYKSLDLKDQTRFLLSEPDISIQDFCDLTPKLLDEIAMLEPFGTANPTLVFEFAPLTILNRRTMGADNQHVKYTFADADGRKLSAVSFNSADKFTVEQFSDDGEPQKVRILIELIKNEWNGVVNVEGKLLRCDAMES